jgi:hypothetical protein
MISEHVTEWLGLPVKLFDAEASEEGIADYAHTIYRLALDWDAEVDLPTLFSRFLAHPAAAQTPAIIIGQYHGDDPTSGSEAVVQLLVSAAPKLPNLRGIFIGDMVTEENEVSWIVQSDVSPVLAAYPNLEHLRLRGTQDLSLGGRLQHARLRSLTIETGGLPRRPFQEVLASELPALESLELWLGTESYDGEITLEDLQPLLAGNLFPALKHLGLRDSEIADGIAEALKTAPLVARLESLDLSLGTLSDAGGQALLDNPALKNLKQLDLHRHYLSKKMMAALKGAFRNVNVDEPEGDDTAEDDRYVAVGE